MSLTSDVQPLLDFLVANAQTLREEKPIAPPSRVELDKFFEIATIAITTVYEAAHHGNVRSIAAVKEIELIRHRK